MGKIIETEWVGPYVLLGTGADGVWVGEQTKVTKIKDVRQSSFGPIDCGRTVLGERRTVWWTDGMPEGEYLSEPPEGFLADYTYGRTPIPVKAAQPSLLARVWLAVKSLLQKPPPNDESV
jgi:hypothetical protein